MEYMLLFWNGGQGADDVAPETTFEQMATYVFDLVGKGKLKGGSPLHPAAEAKTIKKRRGKTTITDGPYTETKEVIGGYLVIEADSMDDALELARTCPAAEWGGVEVREVLPVG